LLGRYDERCDEKLALNVKDMEPGERKVGVILSR
jgi:hypothetical protein